MKRMKVYIINIVLAVALVYILSSTAVDMQFGAMGVTALLLAVYGSLWLMSWFYDKTHFRKVVRVATLFVYFIKELIMASLKVAYDIVTPNFFLKPGIVAVPLAAKTDLEITLLANMISLTPGSLSIAVSEDRKTLYVHSLYGTDDKITLIEGIKTGFERRILEITR